MPTLTELGGAASRPFPPPPESGYLPPLGTHQGRINGPVPYWEASGNQSFIPLGPCLVEQTDAHSVQVIWGSQAQRCVAMPLETAEAARASGNLVLLD